MLTADCKNAEKCSQNQEYALTFWKNICLQQLTFDKNLRQDIFLRQLLCIG
jgi:hypothetical protein